MPHLQPKKRFGQHFLHDRGIVQRILDAFDPQPGETLVEIGPGPGALTRPLLERCTTLHVVELDRDLVARLRADYPPAQLVVHEADALKFDFCRSRRTRTPVSRDRRSGATTDRRHAAHHRQPALQHLDAAAFSSARTTALHR
jgi:16S rRNA A1518/A1519 N6-dimethyltransferase RsmA/KsgA/DIM1 with predicted DNA glycosylase/AP lyase activity